MSVKTFIVDLKVEQKQGNKNLVSSFLEQKIKECLDKKEQALLFLNKRGHSSTLLCMDCGEAVLCDHCDISMTTHKHPTKHTTFLLCHYCGTISPIPLTCAHCKGNKMKTLGTGTQRAEEEVQKLFPAARVQRMDFDTTRTKGAHKKIYMDIKNHNIDIVLGTQMLAKGLDIPNITLVGILNADMGLHLPDFRASERTFQLITQVLGRTSRKGQEGVVVIQTYQPTNNIIEFAAHQDYKSFYEYDLAERRDFNYPPFSQLVKCTYVHRDRTKAYSIAKKMYEHIKTLLQENNSESEVYISPAFITKQYDKYHYNVIIKGKDIQKVVAAIPFPTGWRIDVDPIVSI